MLSWLFQGNYCIFMVVYPSHKDTGYRWLSTSNAPVIYLLKGGGFAVKYATKSNK